MREKLEKLPNNLSSLKSKLETTSVDLKELNVAVDNELVKKTQYDK